MKVGKGVMPLKMTSTPYLESRIFDHSRMADVQTSEVDPELAPVNVG
jgi:hypothetical protein